MSEKFRVRLMNGKVCEVLECIANKDITEVLSFPKNIDSLDSAFLFCTNLKSIPPIPKSVKSCEAMVAYCSSLSQDIEVPCRVEETELMIHGSKVQRVKMNVDNNRERKVAIYTRNKRESSSIVASTTTEYKTEVCDKCGSRLMSNGSCSNLMCNYNKEGL